MTSKYTDSNALDELTLGKKTEYFNQYDPTLLQGVPRSLNRDDLNLQGELPFKGEDLWTGYELSWLNSKGKPQVAIAEFIVPFDSENLIESKSFKLYLNSFNQTRFDNVNDVVELMKKDLSACATKPVSVTLHSVSDISQFQVTSLPGTNIDDIDIDVDNYQFDPELLNNSACPQTNVSETINSHLLKSNCLITNQPDWASIIIEYKGNKIDHSALLKYLVSFRMHNEFHEQCVERIFVDIMKYCQPSELTVYARYTRRGGLDINPFRSNVHQKINSQIRLNRQ